MFGCDKMNNKGFMMAEVVVVSAIILVFMAGMYVSYNKIISAYKQRVDYYDVTTLYKLAYYRDSLKSSNSLTFPTNDSFNKVSNSIINSSDRVYIIYNNNNNLKKEVVNSFNDSHAMFKDYVTYLSSSTDLTGDTYVMVLESCEAGDENDCKYAYLGVGK